MLFWFNFVVLVFLGWIFEVGGAVYFEYSLQVLCSFKREKRVEVIALTTLLATHTTILLL